MNTFDRYLRTLSKMTPVDILLAEVAIRIQLSPTDHQTAVDHFGAIHDHIERPDSPLFGLVEEFYVQGSFPSARLWRGAQLTTSSTWTR